MIKITKRKIKFVDKKSGKSISLPSYNYKLDIFDIRIVVLFGGKNINKLSKLWGNNTTYVGRCIDYLKECSEVVMIFRENPDVNTVAHECTHACDYILKRLHYNHPNDANEINAHLTGHLVEVVMKAKIKYKRGKKNDK